GYAMIWHILVCGLGWVLIGCHAWSLKWHFDMPQVPSGVRVISTFVILNALFLTFLSFSLEQPAGAQVLGFGLLMFSFVLFWITIRESSKAKLLAAFDEKLPHGLLKSGPYAYVRHPFYTSYLIQWAGWTIAVWNIWAIVPVISMTVIYWVAARDEENKFLRTDMADEYREFVASTGRFFPKLFR
ncbi:MAG: methyltransferase family protein, partial [Rhizobiaceae bacterium]